MERSKVVWHIPTHMCINILAIRLFFLVFLSRETRNKEFFLLYYFFQDVLENIWSGWWFYNHEPTYHDTILMLVIQTNLN